MANPELIKSIEVCSPFGDDGLAIHCPICGHLITREDDLDFCEHCLAAYLDGDLIGTNQIGEAIFEERTRPDLFEGNEVNPYKMLSTGSNFIFTNQTGGMACGPVWSDLDLVFEAYPERLTLKQGEDSED
jgi:hypothetical protein